MTYEVIMDFEEMLEEKECIICAHVGMNWNGGNEAICPYCGNSDYIFDDDSYTDKDIIDEMLCNYEDVDCEEVYDSFDY